MQEFTDEEADCRPDNRQQDIFAINIGCHLAVIKSEHLDCRELTLALIDVDVVQVVKNDKGEHTCRYNEYDNDNIQRTEHVVKLIL